MVAAEEIRTAYTPLDWQIPPLRDQSFVLLLTGSAGGGKSRVAAEKLNAYCKNYHGATALMMRKSRESMGNSTVLFTHRKVIGQDSQVEFFPSKSRFEYTNNSILAWGGMYNEQQQEQIRSIGQDGALDIVWMEEANEFTEDDFNEILARMRGKAAPWRQIILSCNPDHPYHWINTRLIQGGEATVYYSSAEDNPYNPPEYLKALDMLTGVKRQRLKEGKWVQAEGAVWDEYDPAIHLINRFEIPKEWTRYRVVDFGFTNPFTCQWWAEDNDGRLYRYREIYETQKIVEDHCKEILRLSEGETIIQTVADHDAEDRATMQRHGVYTVAAQKSISPGIQAVGSRLRKAGDGKPRMYFLKNSLVKVDTTLRNQGRPTCTEEEIPGYSWPKGVDGKPIKEDPVKINDHGCDAMRYMVMSLENRQGYAFDFA
ncbi:MAG: phage terminase large subunit [Halobacteriota archaeon]|nr:phage terminase large subunit [Halobacteriota archaeon]